MPEWLQSLGIGRGISSWEQAAEFSAGLLRLMLACCLG